MNKFVRIFLFCMFVAVASFGEETVAESLPVKDTVGELKAEIALRDSLMQVQDSACTAEKDSLKQSLTVESNSCENWKQSYETIKQDNEVCAQALKVSIGVNEKQKEEVSKARSGAATMTTTSFLGGIGLGMLLFWLIFD